MSISPQSLAKTRDKRSLRVPRKFEDFEDEYIPGNYAAALRLKGSKPSSSKRHLHKDLPSNSITDNSGSSSSKKIALATSPEVAPPVPAKTSRPPPRQRSSTPAIAEQATKESPSTSTTSSPSPPLTASASLTTPTSNVTLTTNAATAAAAAVVVATTSTSTTNIIDTTNTTSTAINTDISVKVDKPKDVGTPEIAKLLTNDISNKPVEDIVPSNLFEIDLECKETAPANIDIETKDEEKNPTEEFRTNDFVAPNLIIRTTEEQAVDMATISAENLDKTFLNAIRKSDDNLFKKSPFHPSITISNGVRLGGPSTKPLNEKTKLSSVSILSSQTQASKSSSTTSSSTTSLSASRKRSRGFSLMVKPPAAHNGTASNQTSNTTNSNSNSTSNSNSSPFQNNTNRPHQQHPQVQLQQQPTKYFNSLAQNMQYGTRLMLNEPIYLPKSVPTIAPITNTLIHIANQARRPPYLTKRGEKYYAYQEERKMNILLSNCKALSRVTQYLETKDLLSLRLINKTWKLIIDCDEVWQKVLLNSSHICNWSMFVDQILQRRRVKEITLNEYETNVAAEDISLALAKTDLRQISIRTVNESQSRVAIELLCSLNSKGSTAANITWKVKVVVDDSGLALVPILKQRPGIANYQSNPTSSQSDFCHYFYSICQDSPASEDGTVLVELGALRSLFNNGENDEYKTGLFPCKPNIIIEPI